MTAASSSPQLRSIHALRGAAALMVAVFHLFANVAFMVPLLPAVRWLQGGVDVFFVISGFVMVHATAGRSITPAAFMASRIRRIVPLYWAATLLLLAMQQKPDMLLSSLLFLPEYNPHSQFIQPLLEPGWTLNYEMAFYGLFALALLLPERRRVIALAALLGAAVIAGQLLAGGTAFTFYTRPIVLEFAAGMALAQWRLRLGGWAVLLGLAAMAVLEPLGLPRIVALGLPAALIVAGALGCEERMPRLRPVHFLGSASYALYLFHLPAMILLLALWPQAAENKAVFLIAGLTVMLLAGAAAHRFIEQPLAALLAPRRQAAGPKQSRPEGTGSGRSAGVL